VAPANVLNNRLTGFKATYKILYIQHNRRENIMTMSKAAANKIVKELFYALPTIHIQFSTVADKMYAMELAAEKQHRVGRESVKGFSAGNAAMYFTVKHLFDAMTAITTGVSLYTVKDLLHIRNECLYAQAYAEENYTALLEWMHKVESSEFSSIDYAKMMKP
jgi:hypothetical protein